MANEKSACTQDDNASCFKKWFTRAAILALVVVSCQWLDTIKVSLMSLFLTVYRNTPRPHFSLSFCISSPHPVFLFFNRPPCAFPLSLA